MVSIFFISTLQVLTRRISFTELLVTKDRLFETGAQVDCFSIRRLPRFLIQRE